MEVIYKANKNGGGKQKPKRVIIHSISEYIEGKHASDFLEDIGLSAHFLVSPCGELIKCRSTESVAYHAKGNNENTIGIELLVESEHNYEEFIQAIKTDCFFEDQYTTLIEIVKDVMEHWEIGLSDVVRHSDIDPHRKEDVGSGFKWEWFKDQLK